MGCVSLLACLVGIVGSLRVNCCLSLYLVLGTLVTLGGYMLPAGMAAVLTFHCLPLLIPACRACFPACCDKRRA